MIGLMNKGNDDYYREIFKMSRIPIIHNNKEKMKLAGQHEAGHYIAAKERGFKTGDITLTVKDNTGSYLAESEIEIHRPIKNLEMLKRYLEDRVIVLYSGVLAEALSIGCINVDTAIKHLSNGGKNDRSKINESIHLLRNVLHADETDENEIQNQLNSIESRLWGEAIEFVETQSKAIIKIGAKIAMKLEFLNYSVALSNDEIETIISSLK